MTVQAWPSWGPMASIDIRRSPGKLSVLAEAIRGQEPEGAVGIGHTRWATHGVVNEANSHPHTDCTGNAAVAHNGIVENYLSLKRRLQEAGHTIRSQTDSEIIAHLVEDGLDRRRASVGGPPPRCAATGGGARRGGHCRIEERRDSSVPPGERGGPYGGLRLE